ncbi:SDR family oxidoreductase [Corynebacterium mendelii]|uniref:SDR family oxidoreductase n=1 Tax=Corynebacterium mendelii TaxID=2765362 RepID=A0A939DZJ6_9CORY|nr:SDR family oxidoreductase [Corynebacterium mendelii]MBN9644154.1 SDR family oxidoreductase [Corynebacterium mendelii]
MHELPVAVVTGATSGIGRSVVDELKKTHRVYALGRNQRALWELDRHTNVTAVEVDLLDALVGGAESEGLAQLRALPKIDALIHSAGVARHGSLQDAGIELWREMADINVLVPALLTKMLLDRLKAAEGTVVFVNSGASQKPAPGMGVYAATKSALKGLADTFRVEIAGHGVKVTTVSPGPTDTPMQEKLVAERDDTYMPAHYIAPQEVAEAVAVAVRAGSSVQLTDINVRPRIELSDRDD